VPNFTAQRLRYGEPDVLVVVTPGAVVWGAPPAPVAPPRPGAPSVVDVVDESVRFGPAFTPPRPAIVEVVVAAGSALPRWPVEQATREMRSRAAVASFLSMR
jgi:hypothetical protein